MTLIKSISGIRGTIGGTPGDALTPIDLVKFTASYSQWLKETVAADGRRLRVVVGRDARLSGQMVSDIVEGTLMASGVDVIAIGLATTPTTEMAVTGHGADGGIILTASHNPKQWNALKLLNAKGEFLNAAEGQRVLEIADTEAYTFPEIDGIGSVIVRESYDKQHIDAVLALPLVDVEAVRQAKFKVVVDAVNSVGGIVMPALLKAMGVEVVELNCTPDGKFAHNPEPIPEHLTEISALVPASGADLGVVVDPDVDRLALINEDGTMFGEEYTLVAVADYVLSKTPGNTVSNLSSSRALADVTARYGGSYAAAAVGEVNVVAKMRETDAVIGGEGNGGVIYPALHSGRDALVGVALLLTYLAKTGKKLSELKATYPAYYISKNRIDLVSGTDVDGILARMKAKYASEKVNDIDGVKIDFPTEWVHLRKSNTEPIIRIYAESRDKASAEALANRIIADIKSLL
ncbi:phosphoglucosamine mutase [Rikenella microfusus]|uniref:Phosphomannomutase/phosphoglucomutase n=1 Tax=Rikenella microfusus TaxID=28139 RepID=A0A379MSL0_9BACT|nr:phosphoglucosamine mutase [Rikenella microfusus]SUE34651.1 Phosphomannomutase/phosphoglucomutase [Rikenella microfusus]HJE88358.1 phosphoglucosamine mutase [Rikenella microfusus]